MPESIGMMTQAKDLVKITFISLRRYYCNVDFEKVLPYVDGWIQHPNPIVAARAGSNNKEKDFELRPILATSTKINQPSRRRMEHGKRPCDCGEKEKRNYFSRFDFLVPDLEDEYSSRIMKRNQNRLIVAN